MYTIYAYVCVYKDYIGFTCTCAYMYIYVYTIYYIYMCVYI